MRRLLVAVMDRPQRSAYYVGSKSREGEKNMHGHPGIGKVTVTLAIKGDSAVPELRADSLGDISVGPNGFLRLLETQLGIPARDISFTARLIQYLGCIDRVNHAAAFYHDSYQADPFSVCLLYTSPSPRD